MLIRSHPYRVRRVTLALLFTLTASWLFVGYPVVWDHPRIPPEAPEVAYAANAAGDAIVLYGSSTGIYYQIWSSSTQSLSAPSLVTSTSITARNVVLKSSPVAAEMLAGVQDTSGNLYLFRWDGTAWSTEWSAAVGVTYLQAFDIAYEYASGEALVAYSASTTITNELKYRVWQNGSSTWTGEQDYNAVRTTSTVTAVQMIQFASSTSNDIGIVWGTANNASASSTLSANYWDGVTNTWIGEPSSTLSVGLSYDTGVFTDVRTWAFDIAFESLSGELLIVWGNEAVNDLQYITRTAGVGGSWGSKLTSTPFNEEPYDIELASAPDTNRIGYANSAPDSGNDMEMAVWTGSAWPTTNDTTSPCSTANNICNIEISVDTDQGGGTSGNSLEWLSSSTARFLVLTYDDLNAAGIDWFVYSSSTDTWNTEMPDCTTSCNSQPAANDDRLHRNRGNPFNSKEMLWIGVDVNNNLWLKKLTLTGNTTSSLTWSSADGGTALTTNISSANPGFAADLAYFRNLTPPPSSLTQSNASFFENVNATSVGPLLSTSTWYSSEWVYRQKVTIDKTKVSGTAALSDFPALIAVTSTALKHASFANGHVGIASGTDILFTSSDGTTKLAHEIEKYSSSTGELVAWVKVPTLATSTDTTLYMYYGSATTTNQASSTGVWSANYAAVWHLSEATTSLVRDSTANANHATSTGTTMPLATSTPKIDGNLWFDGSNDYLQAPHSSSLNIGGTAITLSAWVKFTNTGQAQTIIGKPNSASSHSDPYHMYSIHLCLNAWCGDGTSPGSPRMFMTRSTGGWTYAKSNVGIAEGVWGYVVGTYDGSLLRIYLDGVLTGTTTETASIQTNSVPLRLGANGGLGELLKNGLDEVRISNTTRSGAWIATEYNNQSSPSAFASFAEEEVAATAPAAGTGFRLRQLIHVAGATLAQSGQNFTLQYAGLGTSTSCASPLGTPSTYTNINGTSTHILWYDNAAATDNTLLTASSSDPTHNGHTIVNQTYEEANDFTNSQGSIAAGQDGKWDFALTVSSTAPTSTVYCFRVVKAGGSVLDSYGTYPLIKTTTPPPPSVLTQSNSVLFENVNATSVGPLLATTTGGGSGWYSTSWAYRQPLVIDKTKVSGTAALSDFPVLIAATSSVWRDTANGGHVGIASGTDILFTSSDGTTKLAHEIEYYASSTGELVAWVKVPTLATSTDTTLYLYYGSATTTDQASSTGVWNSAYKGVWHLKEDPSGSAPQARDSTSNAYHGTAKGGGASPSPFPAGRSVAGKIGQGVSFAGDRFFDTSSTMVTDYATNGFTFSYWERTTSTAGQQYAMGGSVNSGGNVQTGLAWSSTQVQFETGAWTSDNYFEGSSIAGGSWKHVAVVWDRAAEMKYIYIDGALNASEAGVSSSPSTSHGVLRLGASDNDWGFAWWNNGALDQVETSNIPRSGGWIATEYNNQNSPSTFFSTSTEESGSSVPLAPAAGTGFRLRQLIHVAGATLAQSGQNFTLQYAGLGTSTSCASPLGTPSTYTNINGTSTHILWYDNAAATDNTLLTASSSDPTHNGHTIVNQTYEEANDFTNSQGSIAAGQDGKWDFALTVSSTAPTSTVYCFRVVKSGGTDLDSYESYPQVKTLPPPSFTQSNTVFFENVNATSVGPLLATTTGGGLTVTSTLLTVGAASSTNSTTTASITPSANKLVLLAVGRRGSGSITSVTGNGLTWVQITDQFNGYGDGDNGVVLFRAMGSNPTSGPVTINFASTQTRVVWSIVEFGNVDTSGTNGSGAIVQVATSSHQGNGSITATLGAFGSASNATYGSVVIGNNTITPGSGFSALHEVHEGDSWDAVTMTAEFRTDNDTTVDATFGYSAAAIIAVEIKYAASAPAGTALVPAAGTGFRLRQLIHVADATLAQSGQNFTLQYAGLGTSTSCASPNGTPSTYTNINGTSTHILWYDNAAPTDNTLLTASSSDPTHNGHTIVNQTYEEANDFTNSQASIAAGQDGKWDFALTVSSTAPTSTVYCFRVVKSGGTDLDSYESYPAAQTAAAAAANSPPTVSDVVLNSGSAITLVENTSTSIAVTATVTDTNGYSNISYATSVIYRAGVTASCTNDQNNCYRIPSSSCVLSGCSGNSCTATCTTKIQYFAESTDDYGAYTQDDWRASVTAVDAAGATSTATTTSGVELNSLLALDVTSAINYGSLNAGADTGATNQTTVVTNTGNVPIDPDISGTNLTSGAYSIGVGQQKFSSSTFTYSACTSCTTASTTATTTDIRLPRASSTSAVTSSVWWGLGVPSATPPLTFTGTNTFAAGSQIGVGKTWTRSTTTTSWSPRLGPGGLTYKNKMWIIGGWGASSQLNDVWYTSDGMSWTQATSAAAWPARSEFVPVVYNERMWVINGYSGSGGYRDVWWSTDGVTWTQATSSAAWSMRYASCNIVYNNKMWVLGGNDGGEKNDVWWSTDGVTWTQATSSAAWTGRHSAACVVYNSKMWIMGGYTGAPIGDVWWSTDGVNWTRATSSAAWSARYLPGFTVFNNKMWILGGNDGGEKNDVWWSTDGVTWTQATSSAAWTGRHDFPVPNFLDSMWVLGGYTGSRQQDYWYSNP